MPDLQPGGAGSPPARQTTDDNSLLHDLRNAQTAAERERLQRLTRVVALAYVVVAMSHLVLLSKAGQLPMIVVALGCAVALYLGSKWLAQTSAGDRRDTWVTWLLLGCIIGHSLLRLHYAHEPSDMVFVGVLTVAIALIPSTLLTHTVALGFYLTGWAVTMAVTEGSRACSPYLGSLVLAVCLALTLSYLESSRKRRLFAARLQSARRRARLVESEAERRHALASLEHEAHHDSLTGMPNRACFVEKLEQAFSAARQGEQAFAVLYLDIDRFKLVNESLGHEVGDRLLRAVSERLLRFVRPGDAVARLSGDEFAILLVKLRAPSDALVVAERVHTIFEEPFLLGDYEVPLSASIGIAPYSPETTDGSAMLRDADIAMMEAKQAEESQRVFDGAMHARAVTRLNTELDLRRALKEGQLEVHYQPLVRLADDTVIGVEALVRWRHPERGLVQPGQFLPLAEETGLIVELDRWVATQACRDVASWCRRHPQRPVFLSVNASARTFAQADFPQQVQDNLAQSELPPEQLWVEIVESAIMDQPDLAEERIRFLRKLGVTVAVDDFGVGYSSLGYLQRFDFNVMKLDRTFVNPTKRNLHLLDALVRIAEGLEMTVVAEGIEELGQLTRVRELGVDIGQGFLFAKPMPSREAEALLADDAPLSVRPPEHH